MSVALNVGTVPLEAFPKASFSVIVIVEVDVPSAATGLVPTIDEVPATAAPPTNVTIPPDATTGVAIESVFTSALVDFKTQVETPLAFEIEQLP